MKSLNWSKIPAQKLAESAQRQPNLWSLMASRTGNEDNKSKLDFELLEGLFCQPAPLSAPNSKPGSPMVQRRQLGTQHAAPGQGSNSSSFNSLDRLSGDHSYTELHLLDSKKSWNLNIFLKQHRGGSDDLIQMIASGEHKKIGPDRLRHLLKLLPEENEVELLKKHQEEHWRMPTAEKFLLQLIQVPK